MRFIETPVFTRVATTVWTDDEYHALQLALFFRPEIGAVIPKSGGVRKMRWSAPGTGKRGGVRVIDYWDQPSETFYMLYAYRKSEQGDLTAAQIRKLSGFVREELK